MKNLANEFDKIQNSVTENQRNEFLTSEVTVMK